MICSDYHLILFFRLIIFDCEDTVLIEPHKFRLESLFVPHQEMLFLCLIFDVEMMRVHVLEQHLLKCPSRVDMVKLSQQWVMDDKLDFPLSIYQCPFYGLRLYRCDASVKVNQVALIRELMLDHMVHTLSP